MRRFGLTLTLALLASLASPACTNAHASPVPWSSLATLSPVHGTDNFVHVTEANASCTIKISGRPYVNAANDIWGSGNVITRYNRSRVIRMLNWTDTTVRFVAFATPAGDGYVAVVSAGALVGSTLVPLDNASHDITISGLPAGSKTLEIWDGWQSRNTGFDSGTDQPIDNVYVTDVYIPSTQFVPVRATASVGIVLQGDSLWDGDANNPQAFYGQGGQLRVAAEAAGQLVGYYTYGSGTLAGDGRTAAQSAQDIHDLWAAMGATTKKLIYFYRPNDFKYWDIGGSIKTTPTQLATFLAAELDALTASDSGYTAHIGNPAIPQGTAVVGPNGGGFLRSDYETAIAGVASGRAQVTLHGLTGNPPNLSLSTDYFEAPNGQVHLIQSGHDKVAPVVRGWIGL